MPSEQNQARYARGELRASIEQRSLWQTLLLTLLFGHWFFICWMISTKEEINRLGGNIPTGRLLWLMLFTMGLIVYYYQYRYAKAFCSHVAPRTGAIRSVWLMWILFLFLFPGIIYAQVQLNKLAAY